MASVRRPSQTRRTLCLFPALCLLLCSSARGQGGAITWIPTQGQNSLIAQLSGVSVDELSNPDTALSSRSILGVIPVDQVLQSSFSQSLAL